MQPEKIDVKKGTVAWCVCGLSDSPFCNGSHQSTDKKPFVEKVEKDMSFFICRCGHSNNKPFCDGSHVIEKKDE